MAELRRLWTWADTAGFDWIDASDHFYEAPLVHENHGDYWEGTTIMTALACETKNLRIGSLVLGMNYRHPAVLANALAAMDHLSGGRIELGIGAGWYEDEYRAYGIPFPPLGKRLDILEEGIRVIRLLLTEDHVELRGRALHPHGRLLQPQAPTGAPAHLGRRRRPQTHPAHDRPPL